MSVKARAFMSIFPGAMSHAGLIHMLQATVPTLVEINMPAIFPLLPGSEDAKDAIRKISPLLGVQVWSGQHMPKKDLFGRIDTYAEVFVVDDKGKRGAKFTTKVIKSNYHPDWHEPERLGSVPWHEIPNVPANSKLYGVVKDHDMIKLDDTVGHFEAQLPSHGETSAAWCPVRDDKEKDVVGMSSQVCICRFQHIVYWLDSGRKTALHRRRDAT